MKSASRAARLGALLLLILVFGVFGAREAPAQSCAGKVAGDVCRASAGGCDVAETCVATSTPLYQPAEGTLQTGFAWNYTMGYGFTPSKTITVTSLGGLFSGTKTVYLFNRTTGAALASVSVTSANSWAYSNITPVTLTAGTSYSVGVSLAGSGGAYRNGTLATPRTLADATITGSCYRTGSALEPCAGTVISGINYGMADIKYYVGGSQPLYQPTDGVLYTNVAGDYTAGYAFTPNKAITVKSLGGYFSGTRTVYLYNRSTGAVLASASVTSANAWAYTAITPVALSAGTSYTVGVYLPGAGGAYRGSMTSMPSTRTDATIEGSCYRPSSTAEPCGYSGLISTENYGMVDVQYEAANGLVCPADILKSAGTVCRSASGTCDVTEACTGSSAACPTNLFKASGITCDDGQLCTYGDVCNGAGSCGGTTITCGGGNACSTTVCNGTNACEAAKVYCNDPPTECYNTLGACNTTNGSCSYTVKVGASCGTRGTCQSNGTCYTPPLVQTNGEEDCVGETIPAPTPIGCDSCDPTHPCVVDTTLTGLKEYQTCSGYTPRKGDVVVHQAAGLTQLLINEVAPAGVPRYTHIGIFLDPQQPGSNQSKQMVRHQALNMDALADSSVPSTYFEALLAPVTLNKNSAYCKVAQIDPYKLLDSGEFTSGVPNSHTADMVTEKDGGGDLFWEKDVLSREVIIAANRSAGQQVADQLLLRNDYYSLNSLLDSNKGMSRLSGNKPGTNCASALMSCLSPSVPQTLLTTDKIKTAAFKAYEAVRKTVRHMPKLELAVTVCKATFCGGYFPIPACPVDCNGLAWETANGIADQVIACILFGPSANGCQCTRDNRKWHFANWASGSAPAPTQDDIDWVNGRMTDVEFYQDASWTGSAASGQAATTVYPSYTYLPADILKSGNYPSSNSYDLVLKTNATRKYGHCYAPPSLGITATPTYATTNTTLNWTATMTGGDSGTAQYALFHRRVGSGTAGWIPSVNSPSWQASRSLSWTPAANETGDWEIYAWVKDAYTSPTQNGYGYSAGVNAGVVKVVTPLTVTATATPATSHYGTEIVWTATASGGVTSTIQYALFHRRVGSGTAGWIPSVNSPSWQSSTRLAWMPNSSEVDSWEIYVWAKDAATTSTQNTYGYAAGYNAGVVQVTGDVVQFYPAKGWVDGYNTQHIWGWACDPDYPTDSNRVDVYTTSGTYLGTAGANMGSSSGINSACLGGTAHYFDFYPSGGIASGTHFNVWSIDLPYATPGNDNRKTGGTGSIGDGTEFVIP
jgi:hypothetical protein